MLPVWFRRRVLDDERLKSRPQRELHPLPMDYPPADLEGLRRYVYENRLALARHHDQLWWFSLRRWVRACWRLEGFRTPIRRFYVKPGEEWV